MCGVFIMKAVNNMSESKTDVTNLFEKYYSGTCNREEFDQLLDLIEKGDDDEMMLQFLKREWNNSAPKRSHTLLYRRVGAAAVILLLIASTFFLWRGGDKVNQPMVQDEGRELLSEVTRIQLSDGSIVLLRDGSWLNVDSLFAKDSREVSLQGEAYFEVATNPTKPFVIHTGKVKTTVLGTAFSIKANPAETEVTVTVTRGKVMVEDEEEKVLLATLEADRQLVYNTKSNRVTEKTVNAAIASNWRSHHMIFRNSTFESIVQEISELYGVTILFDDEFLRQRQITASLDDRDPIETLLDILCTAQRAYYVKVGDSYLIKPLEE